MMISVFSASREVVVGVASESLHTNYSEAFQTILPLFFPLSTSDRGCDILPKEQNRQRGGLYNLEKLTPARWITIIESS